MPGTGLLYNIMQTDLENFMPVYVKTKIESPSPSQSWQSLRTSEKIQHLLTKFPSSKPANSSGRHYFQDDVCRECNATNCKTHHPSIHHPPSFRSRELGLMVERLPSESNRSERIKGKAWYLLEVIQLIQLAVTTTGLILYYVIYGWMQLIYSGLRMALFFRNADGPMKITLGVVALTSLIVGLNMLMRLQNLYMRILR